MPVDDTDRQLAQVCRRMARNDRESDMVQDFALQLLANLHAIDEDTRGDYVDRLREMCVDEYSWPAEI